MSEKLNYDPDNLLPLDNTQANTVPVVGVDNTLQQNVVDGSLTPANTQRLTIFDSKKEPLMSKVRIFGYGLVAPVALAESILQGISNHLSNIDTASSAIGFTAAAVGITEIIHLTNRHAPGPKQRREESNKP